MTHICMQSPTLANEVIKLIINKKVSMMDPLDLCLSHYDFTRYIDAKTQAKNIIHNIIKQKNKENTNKYDNKLLQAVTQLIHLKQLSDKYAITDNTLLYNHTLINLYNQDTIYPKIVDNEELNKLIKNLKQLIKIKQKQEQYLNNSNTTSNVTTVYELLSYLDNRKDMLKTDLKMFNETNYIIDKNIELKSIEEKQKDINKIELIKLRANDPYDYLNNTTYIDKETYEEIKNLDKYYENKKEKYLQKQKNNRKRKHRLLASLINF